MNNTAQILFYAVSPIGTLLAVFIAYLALLKQAEPRLLVHYLGSSDIPSLIELVVTNTGNGTALDVVFSKPLPVHCFGIERPDGSGIEVLADGLPAIAPNQTYKFDGGQYAGLAKKLGTGLEITVSYKYKNPFGFISHSRQIFILSVMHLQNMPTRISASQAIVQALKGPNKTTLQEIRDQLAAISTGFREHSDHDA